MMFFKLGVAALCGVVRNSNWGQVNCEVIDFKKVTNSYQQTLGLTGLTVLCLKPPPLFTGGSSRLV